MHEVVIEYVRCATITTQECGRQFISIASFFIHTRDCTTPLFATHVDKVVPVFLFNVDKSKESTITFKVT